MNAPPHAHMPCVQTCTHSRVCTHTLPSPGQRAGLARRRQTEVVAELCFPTVPCFWLEGRGSPGTAQEGQPWPSSRPRAHTLLPSSRSVRGHLMLCCPRCHSGGPLEPPSHMWGTPASPAAPTPAGPAPWPHGPMAPASFLVITVCSRHTGLLCGKQTRKQTRQQLTGHGRKRGQFGLRGPLRPPHIGTSGCGHGRPPRPHPFPCTSEAGQVRPPGSRPAEQPGMAV